MAHQVLGASHLVGEVIQLFILNVKSIEWAEITLLATDNDFMIIIYYLVLYINFPARANFPGNGKRACDSAFPGQN